jgi:peptidoglycan/xylan/chitin deacetylase (PgdA/CDA1 family)
MKVDRVAFLPRLTGGGAILCFHSIATPEYPANGDAHVSLDDFKTTLRIARRWGRIVPLSELVTRHVRGRSTSGLIAVTFDDGYEALRREVKEFVRREAVPISVFIVLDAADTGAPFWWDRVDDLFARTTRDRWRAFENACGLPEEYRRGQPREFGPLRPLRQWILASFTGRWPRHLDPELEALEQEVGYKTRHRAMTFAELAELASMPEVEIGVHTISHPVLPLLSDSDLQNEIAVAYRMLRERVGTVLPVLAVPFGLYDERTLRLAASLGMMASLTLSGETLAATVRGQQGMPRICISRTDVRAKLSIRLLGVPQFIRACCGRPLPVYPALPSAES